MATKKNKKAESADNSWEDAAWKLAGPVDPVRVPFAVLTGEAVDVARFCQRNWEPVLGVGSQAVRPGMRSAVGNGTFTEAIADEIIGLLGAFQQAQTNYQLIVDGPGASTMERAQYVLSELRSTIEWYFDDGKYDQFDVQLEALGTAHDGAVTQDDVAAALFDYAELADRHRDKIAGLGGFDAASIAEARSLGAALRELSAGPAEEPAPPEDERALELRNRLAFMLFDRMQRVRAAARFVFRNHPELVRSVTSTYERRKRAATRSRKAAEAEQAEEAKTKEVNNSLVQ